MEAADPAPQVPPILFHYTTEVGMEGIVKTMLMLPSLKANNPKDARYGDGQYLSDIVPGTLEPAVLSYRFVNMPFSGAKFSHYVEIDVNGLAVVNCRPNVFLIPGAKPLSLVERLKSNGKS